jgi:hypothetical protein
MKTKIKEALRQEYKTRLELSEEALEGVAAFGTTYVTKDEEISNFVKGAEPMLKAFVSNADKLRTSYSGRIKTNEDTIKANEEKIKDLEAKLAEATKGNQGGQGNQGNQGGQGNQGNQGGNNNNPEELQKLIAAAVTAAINPLQDKLNSYEAERTAKALVEGVKTEFYKNEYVKAYEKEAGLAWKNAVKAFENGGSKMTSEEFTKEVNDTFNELCSLKGVDTTKPFKGQGGKEDETFDAEALKKSLQASGRLPQDAK